MRENKFNLTERQLNLLDEYKARQEKRDSLRREIREGEAEKQVYYELAVLERKLSDAVSHIAANGWLPHFWQQLFYEQHSYYIDQDEIVPDDMYRTL
jgi:hypothetical protein